MRRAPLKWILWEAGGGPRLGLEFEVVQISNHFFLVGGLEHDFYDFPYVGNAIIVSYVSEGLKPPTSFLFFCAI